MKTLICIFLLFPAALLAQLHSPSGTNPKLDLQRNFNQISLGDNYEKWKSVLFDREALDKNVFSYTLTSDSCCSSLLGNATRLVKVTFQDDRAVSIRIELKDFLEGKKIMTAHEERAAVENAVSEYQMINKHFSILYGEPYASYSNQNRRTDEPTFVVQWLGARTFFETSYYYHKAVYPPRRTVGSAVGLTEKLEDASAKVVVILSERHFMTNTFTSGF